MVHRRGLSPWRADLEVVPMIVVYCVGVETLWLAGVLLWAWTH